MSRIIQIKSTMKNSKWLVTFKLMTFTMIDFSQLLFQTQYTLNLKRVHHLNKVYQGFLIFILNFRAICAALGWLGLLLLWYCSTSTQFITLSISD